MAKNYLPNTFYLRQILNYDLETGFLYWKINKSPTATAGSIAGAKSYGYINIRIDNISYRAHRIIWKMFYGVEPANLIDHINRNRSDNRICNLREANNSQNNANSKTKNKFKMKGVRVINKGCRYEAFITIKGKYKYLGVYDTPDDAHAAYIREAKKYHGEYFRNGD